MIERKALMKQKLAANQRRLGRPARLSLLLVGGIAGSSIGAEQHEAIVATLREHFTDEDWQEVSQSQLSGKISDLGDGDTIFVFDWNLDWEPGFVAAKSAVAQAVASDPTIFGMDGFIVVDSSVSRALFVDIGEDGELSVRASNIVGVGE